MSDLARLRRWFADERLVGPDDPHPTTVDLVRALFHLAGARRRDEPGPASTLGPEIGATDHLVFILIDGLGVGILDRCPPGGFLRAHFARELRATFPSTTAAALTSLATAQYPSRHGIPGWWVYLEEHDLVATVLPFVERFSERPLTELGVEPGEVFQAPAALPEIERAPLTITPAPFVGGVYARYCTGGTALAGYAEPDDAFRLVRERIERAREPTYTSVYFPHIDELAHESGLQTEKFAQMLALLDRRLAELKAALAGRARIVVTGDHGLVELSPERVRFLDEGDPLAELLRCPPTGEPTVPMLHVKPGAMGEFRRAWRDYYGDAFALITRDEADRLDLFGPGPLSSVTRARVGDLIGVAVTPMALYYRRRGEAVTVSRAVHAGLRPAEMRVPLILA